MNILSLFDGLSAAQLALHNYNIGGYFASEVDKYCMAVTQYNFPETKQLGDITKIKGDNLPEIHLLIGGSPCQGFSRAGKELGLDDPRTKLYFEYERLLKETNPKYFLLENVVMKKEDQNFISERLGVKPILINSSLVSAQNRKRLYWTNIPNVGQPKDKQVYFNDIIQDINNYHNNYRIEEKLENKLISFSKHKGLIKKLNKAKTINSSDRGLNRNQYQNAVTNNGFVRRLTPIECERLQTIPDNHTQFGLFSSEVKEISNTQRYKMIGNSFTVAVIKHILGQLM